MTFQQVIQKWLDFKWPKRYNTSSANGVGYGIAIDVASTSDHILCVSSNGETCLRDNRKDLDIKIVPLADPKYFRQLHNILKQQGLRGSTLKV